VSSNAFAQIERDMAREDEQREMAREERASAKAREIANKVEDILHAAQRHGLAHNHGAGGQYLLCATEAQLVAFAEALADRAATDAYAEGRKDEQEELASLLPGAYYMDPPDGGNVSLREQFERMARDAEQMVAARAALSAAGVTK